MIVCNEPSCTITFGVTPVVLDDYLVAVDVQAASEVVDGRTFGKPRRSRMGGGTDTITLALRWSQELYAALKPHERVLGSLVLTPVVGGDTIEADVRFGVVPFGQYKPGEAVEVDLVLGVPAGIAPGS